MLGCPNKVGFKENYCGKECVFMSARCYVGEDIKSYKARRKVKGRILSRKNVV